MPRQPREVLCRVRPTRGSRAALLFRRFSPGRSPSTPRRLGPRRLWRSMKLEFSDSSVVLDRGNRGNWSAGRDREQALDCRRVARRTSRRRLACAAARRQPGPALAAGPASDEILGGKVAQYAARTRAAPSPAPWSSTFDSGEDATLPQRTVAARLDGVDHPAARRLLIITVGHNPRPTSLVEEVHPTRR